MSFGPFKESPRRLLEHSIWLNYDRCGGVDCVTDNDDDYEKLGLAGALSEILSAIADKENAGEFHYRAFCFGHVRVELRWPCVPGCKDNCAQDWEKGLEAHTNTDINQHYEELPDH